MTLDANSKAKPELTASYHNPVDLFNEAEAVVFSTPNDTHERNLQKAIALALVGIGRELGMMRQMKMKNGRPR